MHGKESVHRLHLDDDEVLNNQIDAIARVEDDSLVSNRDRSLDAIPQIARAQLEPQARHVCRFQQTGTDLSMDLDGRADDLTCDCVERRVDEHAAPSEQVQRRSGNHQICGVSCFKRAEPSAGSANQVRKKCNSVRLRASVSPCDPVPSAPSVPSPSSYSPGRCLCHSVTRSYASAARSSVASSKNLPVS